MFALLMTTMIAGATEVHLSLGQSLSQGGTEIANVGTSTATTITQPYSNLMINHTIDCPNLTDMTPPSFGALVPLIESDVACTIGDFGESHRSAYANRYTEVTGNAVIIVPGGQGGTAYVNLKKDTRPFTITASALEGLAARDCTYKIDRGVFNHGEADDIAGTTRAAYAADLLEYWTDWNAKVQSLCHDGPRTFILFISQLASWTKNSHTTSGVPLGQYDAARLNPTKLPIYAPMYPYTFNASGIHLTNTSYTLSGKVAGAASGIGASWQPLWPQCAEFPSACTTSPVTRSGAVITLQLYTPTPPLVIGSCARITGVSSSTRGFEYTDSAGAGTISSVASGGACVGNVCPLTITLSADPTGHTAKLLRYAYTGVSGNNAGPTAGPRGNVCDSRSDPDANYLTVFEESVP